MSQVWGFADTHAHLMAHLGYGGKALWGQPYHPEGLHAALADCAPAHGPGGIFTGPEIFHGTGGWPRFDGWPRFTTMVHQQMYLDWIKRTYESGLRLICCLVTHSELIAERSGIRDPAQRDDKTAIKLQIDFMKSMVSYVDTKSGGPGQGWMQIADSPARARQIIGDGKLAVILGVEVDALGNWKTPDDLPDNLAKARQLIRKELRALHDVGVRQITPIHLSNNAFGGCAVYHRMFDAVNRYVTGQQYVIKNAWETGVRYRLDADDGGGFLGLIKLGLAYGGDIPQVAKGPGSHANARGLTCYGRILLEEMIKLGMIIDIDHFSERGTDEALAILEAHKYPPLSSHTGFREMGLTGDAPFDSDGNKRRYGTSDVHKVVHESLKRPDQLDRMRRLGGVVAPILLGDDCRDVGAVLPALSGKVKNDCAGSSKSWAQNYLYAAAKMKGRGVALASDFGGLIQHPGPRFGPRAAYGLHEDRFRVKVRRAQAAAQTNGVRYVGQIKDQHYLHRFDPAIDVLSPDEIYTLEERDTWVAIAVYMRYASLDWNKYQAQAKTAADGRAQHLALGFRADHEHDLLQPGTVTGDSPWEQRAAYLVRHGQRPGPSDPAEVQRLHPLVKGIWDRWTHMEGSNSPLKRSEAGVRDFDINVDGLAHYGLIPDFIQDLKNVGLTNRDLEPLYRSAEDYLQMWETCESRR